MLYTKIIIDVNDFYEVNVCKIDNVDIQLNSDYCFIFIIDYNKKYKLKLYSSSRNTIYKITLNTNYYSNNIYFKLQKNEFSYYGWQVEN